MYNIKFVHSIPTKKQFEEWGIQTAYPKFYLQVYIFEETKQIMYFKIEYKGNFNIDNGYITENKKITEYDIGNFNENEIESIVQKILIDEDYQSNFNSNVGNSILDECHICLLECIDSYSRY